MSTPPQPPLRVEALCWNQYTDWAPLEAAALRAERLGYDGIWTWDHLQAVSGPAGGPILDGWATVAAWAATTRSARLGVLVTANTFRNPALLAKMVTTLDHVSGGRAVLGIGAGRNEAEHRAFGLAFGQSAGERLRRLEEAVRILRTMLDGDRASGTRLYGARGAVSAPRPLQRRLPILVGGGGERRTLRIVARYADACNVSGTVDAVRRKDAALRSHCLDVGRDESEIERTLSAGPVVIRDSEREARREFDRIAAANGVRGRYRVRAVLRRVVVRSHPPMWRRGLVGTPETVAAFLTPYVRLGFRTLMVGMPAPYDAESMERMAREVRPLLELG